MSAIRNRSAALSQRLMIFILSMSLYGMAALFAQLIPSFRVGVVEFSVKFFLFIPLSLSMLFDPISAALGAAAGKLVFSGIMLGQFTGLGDVEEFLAITVGVYLAGRLVKDPGNRVMVGIAAITGTAVYLAMGAGVDILKVLLAVGDFVPVAGLPENIFATEGFAFLNDLLLSGVLFCLLPTLYLVPKLYGKIEPLLGMPLRTPDGPVKPVSTRTLAGCALGFYCAVLAELTATAGMSLHWEPIWAQSGAAMIIALAALLALRKNAGKRSAVICPTRG